MALTATQLRVHLQTMLQNYADTLTEEDLRDNEMARGWFLGMLRACIQHRRLGDADSIEAAQTVARNLFEIVIGRAPTAQDLHWLRAHLARDADETAGGLL